MVLVRKAHIDDASTIMEFQLQMAMETEGISLDQQVLLAGIQRVFEKPELGCYYVACTNDSVIASLLITYEWSDWRNKTIFWIQSVFVDPQYRRKGIYRQMYATIMAQAIEKESVGGIRLYVDKTNFKARETYTKLGMNGEHYLVFEWMK